MRKDTQATRRRIIDAAEKLFAEKGVEASSLLKIARAAYLGQTDPIHGFTER